MHSNSTKSYYFTVIILFLAFIGVSQNCLPSGITFSTQSSVDNFSTNYPGCTHIGGNVTIGTAITDVSPLSQLISIGGHLVIRYNTSLTSISGFNNLTNVGGDLEIRGNNNVTQISAFNSLATIGGHFILDGNLALTSISDMPSLTSISNDLFIRGNNALASFTGFNSLATIGGHYFLDGNLALTGIPTMPSLTSVANDFKIRGNNALVSFSGYSSLATIGGHYFLDGNLTLTGIPTMPSLTSVANDFWIRGNNSLVSFSGFDNLTTIGGHYFLDGNLALTGMATMPSLVSIANDFYLRGNNSLVSFSGFNNLITIGGRYFLDGNTALTSINALQNLTTISNDLWIRGSNSLVSLNGLQSLTAVNGIIRIQNNIVLSICNIQSLCDLLPGNGTQISGNATGCNSVTEVLNLCQTNPPNISIPLHNDICNGSPTFLTVIKANDNNAIYDNYKFRFYNGDPNNGGSLVETIIVPKNGGPTFLTGSTLQYQQTYWGTVAVEVNGVYSTEGSSCSFSFINNNKMISAQCDANIPILSTIIASNQSGFEEYKFVYYSQNPVTNPNSRIDSVNMIPGQNLRYYETLPNLMIQQQYYVQVFNKIRNSWSAGGPVCHFTLVNDVKLISAHCNSNNVGILQEYIYSNDILAKFDQYKFRYYLADPNTNPLSIVDSIVLNLGQPRYYSDTLHNLMPEQQYYVTVSILFRGVWSQAGPVCTMRLGNNVKLISSHCNSNNVGIYQEKISSNDVLTKFAQYKFRYYTANPTTNPNSIVDSIVMNTLESRFYSDTLHNLTPGQEYYATISIFFRGVWLQPGPVCTMRLGNNVKLISSHCNSNNVGIYQEKISSNDVLIKFAQYKFRYYTEDPTINPNSIVDSIVMNQLESRFYADTLHNLIPEQQYFVTVSIFFRGIWTQPGPVCTMRLGNNIKLISSHCNSNNVGLYQERINSNDVLTKFAQYKFRYYTSDPLTNPNSIVDSITINQNESIYYSDALPNLNLNLQYYATVSILFRGVWTAPGPVCTIKLQNNIKLISGHCNNQNVAIFQERINSNDVLTRFDQYKFKYYTADPTTNPGSFVDSVILVRNQSAKYKDEAKFLDLNTVYYATVSILYKGSWSLPGPVCSLTLINNLQIRQNLCNQNVKLNDVILANDNNAQFDTYRFKFYSQNPVSNPSSLLGEVELYKNDPKTFAEATPFLALGQTYWVTVSLVYNDEVSNPSAACTITLSNPIQLHPDLCGQLIPIDTPIAADDNNLVFSQYKYKIYDTGPASNPSAFLYEFVVSLGQYPTFLASFPGAEFNNEYFITVSPGVNNSFPFAGAACSVTFINDVKLHPNLCNDDVYENDLIIADDNNVVFDEYRFTFYDADPSGTASQLGQVTVANGQQPTFAAVAPFLLNSQTIWVNVSVKKNGVFSNVGPACSFNYVLPCLADAGDLSNNALDPAILATERGTDLMSNNQEVIFSTSYVAVDEEDPGATYSYALLLVNRFNKIKQYTINGSTNHGNFDYATLAPGTHYVYGLSYKNTVPVSQYLDNIIAQNLVNDITKIASDAIANGGNFCLNLDNGTVSGHSQQIEITPTVSDYFWVNGTGNWSDVGHWAKCSGCTNNLQTSVPVAGKNVYFDENSGFASSSVVTMDLNFTECTDMDWSGVPQTEAPCGPEAVGPFSGSITNVPNTTWVHPWGGGPTYYRVHSFVAPSTGTYTFSGSGGGIYMIGCLYEGNFNPNNSISNLKKNAYYYNSAQLFSENLTCGQTYHFVVGTYYNQTTTIPYLISVDYILQKPKLKGAGNLYVFGSLTLSPNIINEYNGDVRFGATDSGNTITMGGNGFKKDVYFEGNGGEYILQDSMPCVDLYLNNGTLNTNNQPIKVTTLFSRLNTSRNLYLGSSRIMAGRIYFENGSNFTFDAGTSELLINTANYVRNYGGNKTFYEMEYNGYGSEFYDFKFDGNTIFNNYLYNMNNMTFNGINNFNSNVDYISNSIFNGSVNFNNKIVQIRSTNFNATAIFNKSVTIAPDYYNTNQIHKHSEFKDLATITGKLDADYIKFEKNGYLHDNNTIDTLILSPGYSYFFGAGKTQTISDSLRANGSGCGASVSMKSATAGSQATISKTGGNLMMTTVILQDLFFPGNNNVANSSLNLGNTTGINVNGNAARDLVWVGGSGNWSDQNHWALQSTGIPGECIPTSADRVLFTSSSGFTTSSEVNINIATAYCKDMDWSGVPQTEAPCGPEAVGPFSGSITNVPNTTWVHPWGGGPTYYRVHSFVAPSTGTYTFSGSGGGIYMIGCLYEGNFNPNNSISNLKKNAYYYNSAQLFSENLTCGQTYHFVVGTYYNQTTTIPYLISVDYILQKPKLKGAGNLYVFGSLTLSPNIINEYNGDVRFGATDSGNTITMGGNGFKKDVYFEGNGGEYILQDSMPCVDLYLNNGTLNTNNQPIKVTTLFSRLNTSRNLYLGSSRIMAGRIYFENGSNFTFDAGTSELLINTANYVRNYGGNKTFYEMEYNGYGSEFYDFKFDGNTIFNNYLYNMNNMTFNGINNFNSNVDYISNSIFNGSVNFNNKIVQIRSTNFNATAIFNKSVTIAPDYYNTNQIHKHSEFKDLATITGKLDADYIKFEKNGYLHDNNTIDTLILSPGYSYFFGAGKTQTISDSLRANGQSTALIQLKSITNGTRAMINKSGNRICGSYLSVQDIDNVGTAAFYAGAAPNTQDIGNNNNVIFADCPSNFSEPDDGEVSLRTAGFLIIGRPYPNPSVGSQLITIPIEASRDVQLDFTLTNQQGLVLLKDKGKFIHKGNTAIQISSDLSPGIYFYSIISEGKVYTDKILILN